MVLGAGGGARAVVHGLIREGFQRVIVFNRHLHRGEHLVKHFGRSAAHMELRAMPWHESIIEAELAKTKVLINATSVGLVADETPIPAEILPPDLLVLDLIYAQTRLLRDAEAAGCTVSDGAPMLLTPGRGGVHAVDRAAGAARRSWATRWRTRGPGGSGRPRASPPAARWRPAAPEPPPRAEAARPWSASGSSPPARATAPCWAPWSRACPPGSR